MNGSKDNVLGGDPMGQSPLAGPRAAPSRFLTPSHERLDEIAGPGGLRQQHRLDRRVLELCQIVAFNATKLRPDESWLGPLAIFAVGDVRSGSVKRVAAAVGEGAAAIQSLHQYLALNE